MLLQFAVPGTAPTHSVEEWDQEEGENHCNSVCTEESPLQNISIKITLKTPRGQDPCSKLPGLFDKGIKECPELGIRCHAKTIRKVRLHVKNGFYSYEDVMISLDILHFHLKAKPQDFNVFLLQFLNQALNKCREKITPGGNAPNW